MKGSRFLGEQGQRPTRLVRAASGPMLTGLLPKADAGRSTANIGCKFATTSQQTVCNRPGADVAVAPDKGRYREPEREN